LKFLLDLPAEKVNRETAAYPGLIAGQLCTPLTRYKNAGCTFAVDNGAFVRFDADAYKRLLTRHQPFRDKCLFATAADVVGSARRTLEVFRFWGTWLKDHGWRVALVAQDGIEDLEIPWDHLDAVFIGGTDRFKDSPQAIAVVKAGIALGKHTHVGRVNSPKRFLAYHHAGADTCDGSGASMFSNAMLPKIVAALAGQNHHPLFEDCEDGRDIELAEEVA
jgi:hypothetical protein